jgi:hypothetical protein
MKNLNTYFDKAKNLKINKAIIPNDEIRIVLGKVEKINLPKADKYNNDFIHFLRKYKMTIISSAVLALTFAAFLNNDKIETLPQDNKSEDIAIVNKVTNSSKTETTNQADTKQTEVNIIEDNDNDSIVTLPILKLTDEELSKLGINRVANGYSFFTQSKFLIEYKDERERLAQYGYDTTIHNGFSKEYNEIFPSRITGGGFVKYSGWDITKSDDLNPFKISFAFINKNSSNSNYEFGSQLQSNVKGMNLSNDLSNFNQMYPILDRFNNDYIKVNKHNFPYASQLVSLALNLDSSDLKSRVVFYFIPNNEFLKSVPKKYAIEIQKAYKIIEKIENNDKANEIIKKASSGIKIVINDPKAKPIKMIELTPLELIKLGIEIKNDSVQIIQETMVNLSKLDDKTNMIKSYLIAKGINSIKDTIFIRTPQKLTYNSTSGKDSILSWSESNSKIISVAQSCFTYQYDDNKYKKPGSVFSSNSNSPLLSKNDIFFMELLSQAIDNESLDLARRSVLLDPYSDLKTPLFNKLLPVKIVIGDSTNKIFKNRYSEVIVWFVPTPEFVGALPDRYRSEIEAELNIIAKVESGLASQDELCKGTKVGFFNICNNDNNIKSVNAYPNPVQNEINLEFKLDKKAKVSINLKDISGKIIKNLITDLYLENQSFSQKLSLDGITQGMYLLEIKSSDGSIVIQKILKN